MASARRTVGRALRRTLGPMAFATYVRPLRHVGRKVPYDPKRYYDSRYRVALAAGEFTDATAMKPGHSPLRTRYHYNAVENALLEQLIPSPPPEGFSVLDVGSGAGHWIDFYRDVLGAGALVGLEISTPAVEALAARYADDPSVEIVDADVSAPGFSLGRTFDVVNAVGVLYHVVDDDAWRRAVANLGAHLTPGGRLLVAERVGALTLDVGFHRSDEFESWEELRATRPERMLVGKRLRSGRAWRAAAQAAGLRIVAREPVRTTRAIATPINRVLVLTRR